MLQGLLTLKSGSIDKYDAGGGGGLIKYDDETYDAGSHLSTNDLEVD